MAVDKKYGIVNLEGRVPTDEPVFVLRAQDAFALYLLRTYADLRASSGDNDGFHDMQSVIADFEDWPVKKLPD